MNIARIIHSVARPMGLVVCFASLALAVGCANVPITGRSQLNLVSSQQLRGMSSQQYDQVLQETPVVRNTPAARQVKSVGERIATATEAFCQRRNLDCDFDWEFNLLQDDEQVNAWCMPGGKVAFYTGILPYCEDENGIAVVMGHEIAHALAQHSNERMSQALLAQAGMMALSEYLREKPEETRQMLLTAVGAGAQVGVLLPFSRHQELEADKIGLVLMAMGGYDPRGAVEFWERMGKAGGAKPPEFLSTHPADQRRIERIEEYLPEAMEYYQAGKRPRG